jgi:hypothetical protein
MGSTNTEVSGLDELGDLELLSAALQDAMDAHRQGVIVGPAVDEVALARAERRARRRDTSRMLRTVVPGGAA